MKNSVCATALLAAFAVPSTAMADPSDETQVRTMICDNGQTVEAIIQRSNTKTLHVTTSTSNFVIKRLIREGNVLVDVPGFEDRALMTCDTIEFDLTVIGFFTPAAG